MISSKHFFLITLTITVALLSATTTTAQLPSPQLPSCALKLKPCAQYIKSKKPPASCCKPLREAVTKDHACLCKIYINPNPTLLSSVGMNVTQALDLLPKYCNITGDVTACKAAKDTSGVSRVAWTGMSSLLVLFASFELA